MKKVRCVIADDELLSLEVLENYISKLDNYQIVGLCKSGIEVFNILKTEHVDLLFLDIQMPQLTGLELIKTSQNVPPVVFTTAFREYALEGYELNIIDYLLKPISFERFLRAVDKFENGTLKSSLRKQTDHDGQSGQANPFIYVKSAKKNVKIFLNDIMFIEGMKEFVKIKTSAGEVVTYQTLQDFEHRLPDSKFLRIHRSYIIAIDRIQAFSASHIDIDGTELPIGHSYLRSVKDALEG